MKSWIKALAIGILCGLAFAGLAILVAPLVRADEGTFVNELDAHDVSVTSASIPLGHTVCAKISLNGYDGVTESVTTMLQAGMSSHDTAAFVVFAGSEICPSNIPAIVAWMTQNQSHPA